MLAFSLFDTKVGTYGQPFFFPHPAQCFRALSDLLQDPASLAAKYPADFQLHQLARFDVHTAAFTPVFENHGSLVSFIDTRAQVGAPVVAVNGGEV